MASLKGKTVFITGGSRGIGKAIALRCARDGANVVIAAKTVEPHPKLEGTIYTAAREIEQAGGRALPIQMDIRNEPDIHQAVSHAIQEFGGIDILVNNASAIQISDTLNTSLKKFDLMYSVNVRGTFAVTQACIPWLKSSENPHVLTLSPPLNLNKKWFKDHCAYTLSKYGMSMCMLGMAEEFRLQRIAFNSLWPRTTIATAAVAMLGGDKMIQASRKPEIMADAAYIILSRNINDFSGHFLIDEEVLASEGIVELDQYALIPGSKLTPDFFL